MKKIGLLLLIIFLLLPIKFAFAQDYNIDRTTLAAPFTQSLLGKNLDYRDFLAGLGVKSPIQRTFFNLGTFYETTKFFYEKGTYGLGMLADAEIGLVKYRSSLFASSKTSFTRENHDAGLENLETGLKIVISRAYNDSYSISSFISAQFVEKSATAYVPNDFYNLGFAFSWGIPYVVAFREIVVFGSDFDNFAKYLSRTEVEISREEVLYFGRTSLILVYEYEFIHMYDEKNKNHFELSFVLLNISGVYYSLIWSFGTADEYINQNRIGIIIKF